MSRDFWKSSSTRAFSSKRPLAVRGDLLVDPRDQAIERVAVVRGLAVEIHVNRVGMRLGVGGAGRRLRERPRRDPRRTIQLEVSLDSIQAPLPFSAGTACSWTTWPLTIDLHGLDRRDLAGRSHADAARDAGPSRPCG